MKQAEIHKTITKDDAYFTIYWSPIEKADKYHIINSVPAQAGIFELYYMDDYHKLNLIRIDRVWYGGLRSRLRRITDPLLETNPYTRNILDTYACFYRYSLSESCNDLDDLIFFFAQFHNGQRHNIHSSGRFKKIYVQEISPNKLISI